MYSKVHICIYIYVYMYIHINYRIQQCLSAITSIVYMVGRRSDTAVLFRGYENYRIAANMRKGLPARDRY